MILSAVLSLWVLAAITAATRYRRCAVAAGGLAVAGVLLAGQGWVAHQLLTPLQAAYIAPPAVAWQARNTIVLLGAGTVRLPAASGQPLLPGLFAYSRILRSLALYHDCARQGRRCRILVSGGDPMHNGESEAFVYGRSLLAQGLPAADLLEEQHSANTRQNAAFSAAILQALPPSQIVLVSSAYHLRRARACFEAHDLAVIPVAADVLEPGIGWLPSSYNLALSDVALHEWGGLLRDQLLIDSGHPL